MIDVDDDGDGGEEDQKGIFQPADHPRRIGGTLGTVVVEFFFLLSILFHGGEGDDDDEEEDGSVTDILFLG